MESGAVSIRLRKVSLRYPVFTPVGRAFKSVLWGPLGGRVTVEPHATYVQALDGLDLDIQEGDRLGIIGHNGSGKTTLLRVLSGIYAPQSGEVDIRGKVACFVDITFGMAAESTGWENIALRGTFMGLSRQRIEELTPSIAAFSELGRYLDMPVRTYSAGMFMRLAFAITTSVPQEIIIMDEMIGAGDARFRTSAIARINSLLSRTKIVVVATHSKSILRGFCNKALWLDKGLVRALGGIEEIIEAYEASFEQSDGIEHQDATLQEDPYRMGLSA
jgi:ABC-type polysaccharide/polyol phosphate transport system ATPase subunit